MGFLLPLSSFRVSVLRKGCNRVRRGCLAHSFHALGNRLCDRTCKAAKALTIMRSARKLQSPEAASRPYRRRDFAFAAVAGSSDLIVAAGFFLPSI
jgi:hypothetical protein